MPTSDGRPQRDLNAMGLNSRLCCTTEWQFGHAAPAISSATTRTTSRASVLSATQLEERLRDVRPTSSPRAAVVAYAISGQRTPNADPVGQAARRDVYLKKLRKRRGARDDGREHIDDTCSGPLRKKSLPRRAVSRSSHRSDTYQWRAGQHLCRPTRPIWKAVVSRRRCRHRRREAARDPQRRFEQDRSHQPAAA